jgi:PAS domain S-box-containing protein
MRSVGLSGESADDLIAALPVAVYTTDSQGYITSYNLAAAQFWGRRPNPGSARWCGFESLHRADGTQVAFEDCTLARALASGHDLPAGEAIGRRPDGSSIAFIAVPKLLFSDDGSVRGSVTTLVDITDNAQRSESHPRLAAIIASSSDAIISKDLSGIITSWNRSAERVFGYTADEIVGRSVLTLIPPERHDEEPRILERIRNGEIVDRFETIRVRKDGERIPISLTISPIRAPDGRIIGVSKIARDISDRRETEHRIRALLREVNHRVKNQFAVILSMIRETNNRTADPVQFERLVRERVMALSRSHDLLVHADWRGASLADLVLTHVRPAGDESLMSISGPIVMLNPMAVQYLGMAFQELAMNSARAGTLAFGTGTVSVEWTLQPADEDGERRLVLTWREPFSAGDFHAEQGSFGTLILRKVTPASVSGKATLEIGGDALTWTLVAPLSALEASTDTDYGNY